MMSKAPRWPEVLVNTKIHKPTQKKAGKEASSLIVEVSNRNKQAASSATKATLNGGRSDSISSSDGDGKAVGTLKRSSQKGRGGHWASRSSSRPSRPALQLCSSRSFSSLHTSSLIHAPFVRNSRSLDRLDQRPTRDESDVDGNTQVRKKKVLLCAKLSSEEPVSNNKGQYCGDNDEKKEMSSSSETPESSSSDLSSSACLQHGGKVKKSGKEECYSLVTTGTRRNLMKTDLKNVGPTPVAASNQLELNAKDDSEAEHQDNRLQEIACHEGAEDSDKPEEAIKVPQTMEETSADISSMSSPSVSPISSPCTDSPSPINQTQQAEGGKAKGSPYSPSCVMPSNEEELRPCEFEREQLVKELEQTQQELSRLQQLSSNLQSELQQERESHLKEKNELLFNSNSSSEPASTLQRLQKMNHELRVELEAQKRIHEEAREAELRQRVDILAQQAQLLVRGDATALAQAHLEQERRYFHKQQAEWEHSVSSLKTQLSFSEEKRKESELHVNQLQGELYSHQAVWKEADELKKALQEATTKLRTNEDAQAQKESLLHKHLILLQASQDRERKSLAASLAWAEQHSQELQERLERVEQQVESQDKMLMRSRDIEDTQQQLQEELASSVAAVQRYRDEKEQTERQCQELEFRLSEEHEEVSRLKSSLTTEEAHYRDLKHSYECISEKLLEALEEAQQREAETREMRDSFERHLDTKEQELSEVLLKMEILGNCLEETEAQLNEMLTVCTCASSQVEDESLEAVLHTEVIAEPQVPSDSRLEERDVFSGSPDDLNSHHHARIRSHSLGPSHQYIITSGDDPERFTSVIQLLETKLFVTEEKLREITERLEERQDQKACQDPHLECQLTQSQASPQHLAQLLHSRTRQSQRFAQETENICRLLAGRFQIALNIVRSCREKLQTSSTIELIDFERKLSAVETCLQQGRHDAEKQQNASFNAHEMEEKILSDVLVEPESKINANGELANNVHSDDVTSVGQCLMREFILVEKMSAALKSSNEELEFLVPRKDGMSVAQKYKFIISQILNLNQTNLEGGGENKDHKSIIRGCTEAELIYTAFKIQQQYQNNPEGYNKSKCLADTGLPVFSSYEGQENKQDVVLEKTASLQFEDTAPWLERLITRLQSRAKLLWHFSQECTCTVDNSETAPVVDLNWMQEQAKLLYLTERLHLDFEQEHWQRVVLQDKLQALCKQQVASLTEEREAFKHALCELQEDNRALREELEHAEDKIISMETGNQRLRENKQRIEDYHKERTQKLEAEFQIKIKQLRRIQEEEMEHVQEHHMRYLVSKGKHTANCKDTPPLHKGNSPPTEQQEACQEDFENHQDQRYTRSKMKDFYENNHADSYQDVKPLSEDVRFANVSSSRLGTGQKPDATNATLVKKTDKPSLLRRLRAVRSKSLKEGLSGQERMKLFDSF